MIKFEKNGTVYNCDTPEEAARLSLLLDRREDFPAPNVAPMARLGLSPSIYDTNEKIELSNFISVIKSLPKQVSGEIFARALGLEGVTGLGPRVAGLGKKFGKYGVSIWKLIERVDRPGQPSIWIINKESIDKLDVFQ